MQRNTRSHSLIMLIFSTKIHSLILSLIQKIFIYIIYIAIDIDNSFYYVLVTLTNIWNK